MSFLKSKIAELELSFARFWFKNLGNAGRRRLWLKLAKMMRNGVQILQAIDSIRDRRIASGGKSDPETVALNEWGKLIRNGKRLSFAMDGWVSDEEMMLIAAGEQSGKTEEALESTAGMMDAKKAISSAVVSGVTYPIFLALMAFSVLWLFGFKIVPAFAGAVHTSHGAEWTGLAKGMVYMSDFTRHWLWLVASIIVFSIVAFFISLPRFDGSLRIKLDRYAPYSIYRVKQGSTWLISTAALVSAGLRNESALEQMCISASPWLKTRLKACLAIMRSGKNMGEALSLSGYEFPDREIIDDLEIYSSLSGFSEALAMLGREWMQESVEQIQRKMRVIFGVSILFVGGLVAAMVGGMMAMQLQLAQLMQQSMQ